MEVTLITFISSGSELISTLGNLLLLVVTSKVMTESDFGSTSAMNECVSSIYPFALSRLRFGSNTVVRANTDANNNDQNRDNNQPCAFDDNSQRSVSNDDEDSDPSMSVETTIVRITPPQTNILYEEVPPIDTEQVSRDDLPLLLFGYFMSKYSSTWLTYYYTLIH
ncbi:hypothetical protein GOBAR_AA21185 [Gossypium barbadense]|uniref:Uncharacterized protein n=1 Tax=Gossypium barbadense TaxID=3634 RepID=A0A2P5X7Z4_GOSBA|nr:hypothetical protein GOBAR_AA21185 [Gossypium barbadense]